LQVVTTLGVLVLVLHVVATQPLAAVGRPATHEATGVGPVVTGAGQVVVVQLFRAVGGDAVHVWTPTFAVLLLPQVIVCQPLPAFPVCPVQVCTATFDVLFDVQVVLV